MRLGSQKRKIISLVLVFGCIYAVNACAHPLSGSFSFFISNQAPSDALGDIIISSNSAYTVPCYNTSGNAFSIDIAGSDAPKRISIQFNIDKPDTPYVCYADIQYGGKYTTKVKITSVAATDGGNGPVIKSITRVNGDPLGSDQDFKDWSLTIGYNNNGLLMTEATPKPTNGSGLFTLTYLQQKASAIILTNNNTAPGSHISFNQPDNPPSENPCSFIAKKDDVNDTPALNQVTASDSESKTVYFMPFTNGFKSCQMNIVVGLDTESGAITHVEVDKNDSNSLTVKIHTSSHTTSSTNSMSTPPPLAAFNTWNDSFAIHHGTMMKLNLSKPEQVTFQPTDLPFPLLPTPSDIDLDTLAFDLLNKDLPTDPAGKLIIAQSIFNNYTHLQKKSRDIAIDMLIAAGMMKEHSQIPNDHSFSKWKDFFGNLNSGLNNHAFVIWSTGDKYTKDRIEYWNCNKDDAPCYIPLNDLHLSGGEYCLYPGGLAPDDTLAQTYSAAAFQIASKALVDEGDTSTDPDGSRWSTTYKKISQRMQDAILKNNRSNNSNYKELNGTRAITLLISFFGRKTSHTTYSDTILPLIYLFTQDDTSSNDLDMWKAISTNTIAIEHTLLGKTTQNGAPNNILGAGYKEQSPQTYADQINAGDVTTSPDPTALTNLKPSNTWTFGSSHDDADYVPMSLGAYLLVAGDDKTATDNLTRSGTILNAEMGAIDVFYTDETGNPPISRENTYNRISCDMSSDTPPQWGCNQTQDPLTPLDMSSYLLAQLGLDAHFGRTDDSYFPTATDGPVNNKNEIESLTSSFKSKIKAYVDSKGTDNPIDVSTLSPIMIAGLYIDSAFTTKPTSGTFDNPLIDAHVNSDQQPYYYFTLDPSTSSTPGAQVPAGAQTSYTGVKK